MALASPGRDENPVHILLMCQMVGLKTNGAGRGGEGWWGGGEGLFCINTALWQVIYLRRAGELLQVCELPERRGPTSIILLCVILSMTGSVAGMG